MIPYDVKSAGAFTLSRIVSYRDRARLPSLFLFLPVSSHISNVILWRGMVAYVNSPTRSVATCNELVCKTTNTQEIEASRATCLLHFRASLHRCSTHPCTAASSLLPCMLFLTLEMPKTTVSPVFQLWYLPCGAMLRFKRDGWSDTTAAPFLVWARRTWTQFMRAQAWLLPHTSCVLCLSSQELCLRPLFQADFGMDGDPFPGTSRFCSNSSNTLDFAVNCAQIQARGPECDSTYSLHRDKACVQWRQQKQQCIWTEYYYPSEGTCLS